MSNRVINGSMAGKLFILALLVIAIIASSISALNVKGTPSNWALASVKRANDINIIPEHIELGYKNRITREEFSEISLKLYEAITGKSAILQGQNPFIDTKNTSIQKAYNLGLVKGRGNGIFAPYDMISRQEISVILYRALKAAKPYYNYTFNYQYIFEDDYAIASWARGAVGYLYGIEVINGVGYNMFDPKRNTSKEEAIVLAQRIYDKIQLSPDNLVVSRSGTNRRTAVLRSKLAELLPLEMGKPYQWGGIGPNSYDCSGLVHVLFGKLDIWLPRVARDQAKVGVYVAKGNLMYGDLVFFAKDGKNVHHVGIYVGNGEFVHAPQTGDVVKKSPLMSGYYERVYYTAKRVIN